MGGVGMRKQFPKAGGGKQSQGLEEAEEKGGLGSWWLGKILD